MHLRSNIILTTLLIATCLAQEKWVWNGKTAKAIRDGDRVRYSVIEPAEDNYRGPEGRPPPPDLPPLVRPPPPSSNPPPYRPPLPPKPIEDPTSFEKCKCVHSFNCKSPGLLFGSCDAGKKYCCEKSVENSAGIKGFYPDNRQPDVLAGPGGPVDHIRNKDSEHLGLGSYGRPYEKQGRGPQGGYGVAQRPRY